MLMIAGLLTFLFAPSALAKEDPAGEGTKAEVTTDVVPAIEQNLFLPAEEEVPDWTYRFMIPILVALTLAAVVGTTIQYFVRVVRPRHLPAE